MGYDYNINVRIVIFSLLFISFQIYQHCTGYYDEPLPPQSTLESSFDNCPENILIIIIIVLKIFCKLSSCAVFLWLGCAAQSVESVVYTAELDRWLSVLLVCWFGAQSKKSG